MLVIDIFYVKNEKITATYELFFLSDPCVFDVGSHVTCTKMDKISCWYSQRDVTFCDAKKNLVPMKLVGGKK